MDIKQFYADPNEKPLDRLVSDGGFCGIFRTMACIGDSLSSGELQSFDSETEKVGYHDYFDYSWGQYLARMAGMKVYNFSRGGMTAKWYMETFAEEKGFWNPELACQGYIIALGVNDLHNQKMEVGSIEDGDPEDWRNNKPTFAGYYMQIISRVREISPKSRIFLMTMPRGRKDETLSERHAELLHQMTKVFPFTYVIDLHRYAPVYDDEFRRNFYMDGHMSANGYLLTAKMVASYIDYIIRNNPDDFRQVGFIGTPYHNDHHKW